MDYLVDITGKVGEVARGEDIEARLLTALESRGAAVGGDAGAKARLAPCCVHRDLAAPDGGRAVGGRDAWAAFCV